MATIDSSVYVALRKVVDLDKEADGIEDFHEAVVEEAKKATAITILGGYFNRDYLVKLLDRVPPARRGEVKIQIAIGIEPGRSPVVQWDELAELQKNLTDPGKGKWKFKDVTVKAVQKPRHFHTKLYCFLRTTQPSWYVGSANPTGSDRHELMVRVAGKHEALSAYADAVWKAARGVDQEPEVEIRTIPALFASGFVAYRPATVQLFTFDAFRFTPAERKLLEGGVGSAIAVPFAGVKTEGYGFQLAEALGDEGMQVVESGLEAEITKKVHYRNSSVETALGHWIPAPYKRDIEGAVRQAQERRLARLEKFVERLAEKDGRERAQDAFTDYVDALNVFAQGRGVKARSPSKCRVPFEKFLQKRAALAGDRARMERYCRTLVFTPMPDLSNDPSAARAFRESFFEDVAARAGGKNPRVIRSIMDWLPGPPMDPSDPDHWVSLMTERFSSKAWIDEDWRGQMG